MLRLFTRKFFNDSHYFVVVQRVTIDRSMPIDYVIFDCDGGSDDAWALFLLLKADEEERIKLMGITICGCGNANLENAARNMLRILKAAGRRDVPIYLGAAEALLPTENTVDTYKFHGEDGFGDILAVDPELNDIDQLVMKEHAVTAIKNLCVEHRQLVTLIAVGPLTNIALCYAMYAKEFAESVKSIFIMGGNHLGIGNFSRAAEFNFYSDPEAATIVLGKSLCPITILPWEPCMYERFFIEIEWRLDVLGKRAGPLNAVVDILNKVEHAQWIPPGHKGWNPCDAILVAVFLFETLLVLKQSDWHATVDLRGCHTRGQMVLDHLNEVEKYPKNVRIIELVDVEVFKRIVGWASGLVKNPLEDQ